MKRFLLVVVSVFVLVIIGIISFVAVASRDIPAPDTTDLLVQRSPVADQDNACMYFIAATNSLYWPTNTSLVTDILGGKTNDDAFVSNLIFRNTETLRLVDQGLTCNIYRASAITNFNSLTPHVGKWRSIGRVMALKAMHERQMEQFMEAAQIYGKILRFGNLLQKDAEDVVNYLSAIAILELGLEQTRQLAYASETQETQLIQLLEVLAELTPFDRGLIRAIKADYQCVINTINDLNRGKLDCLYQYSGAAQSISRGKKIPAYFFQPNKTKLIIANIYRDMIKDAPRVYAEMKRYDFERVFDLKENKIKLLIFPNGIGKIIYVLSFSDPDILLEMKCRMECSIAATRLILACKAYEKQHQELPPSLEALIPKYLDAVPRDPYDGKPFRYCPSEGIVYSVGKDLQDSNGLKDLLDNAPCSWIWYAKDIVFGINNTIEPTNLPNSQ